MPPKKGKVVDSAAATRPRRAAAADNDAPVADTPKKRGRPPKAKAQPEPELEPEPAPEFEAAPPANAPKKRGRPPKATANTEVVIEPEQAELTNEPQDALPADMPKRRGRPPKSAAKTETEIEPEIEPEVELEAASPESAPKKRGRPLKTAAEPQINEAPVEAPKQRGRPKKTEAASPAIAGPSKKRGRPKKATETDTEEVAEPQPLKKRGRPAKSAAPAVSNDDSALPKKRGRPPKGGQTTKISADDGAAAEQLEGELIDEATLEQGSSSKLNEDSAEAAEADAGKQYWLMKAEQEDRTESTHSGKSVNTKFTIDDLRAKTEPEAWDGKYYVHNATVAVAKSYIGVRNAQAAKNMRAMRAGDLAFFYASQGKAGRKPGITGIMEIVSEAVPDPTVADPDTVGFVEKESDRERWCVVHVEFRKKLSSPVHLKELQKFSSTASGVLGNMQLLKQSRLSVCKVTKREWDFIVDNLVDGYEGEGEDENLPATADKDEELPAATNDQALSAITNNDALPANTDNDALPAIITADDAHVSDIHHLPAYRATATTDVAATDQPNNLTVTEHQPEALIPTIESDKLSADASQTAPAGPSSRTMSRKNSRAPSASRAGSLAPSTERAASTRGRSRTPKIRESSAQPVAVPGDMDVIEE